MSNTALLTALLGDVANEDVVRLLNSNESLDWSLPLQRAAMRKKKSLIRPGLQPQKVLRVGEQKKQKKSKIQVFRPSPTYWTIGQLGIPYGATAMGDSVVLGGEVFEGWITKDGRRILIGTGIYRTAGNVSHLRAIPPFFDRPEVQRFEKTIPEIAKQYPGIEGVQGIKAAGVFQTNREPSFVVSAKADNEYALDAYAVKLAESSPEKQMAVAVFSENKNGEGSMYEISGVKDADKHVETLLKHGFVGQSVLLNENRILLLDQNSGMRQNIDAAAKELGATYKTTRGDISFIEESQYAKVKQDYEAFRSKGVEETTKRYDLPYTEAKKLTKQQAQYEDPARGPHNCFECEHFNGPHECFRVAGDINGSGWCKEWGPAAFLERARKRSRRPVAVPNQLGQRFWIGVGGGLRNQYGDYSSTQAPKLLRVVSEGTSEHWVTVDGHPVLIGASGNYHSTRKAQIATAQKSFPHFFPKIPRIHASTAGRAEAGFDPRDEELVQGRKDIAARIEANKQDLDAPESQERHLQEQDVTVIRDLYTDNNHSSSVQLATLSDGTTAIFKPASGEPHGKFGGAERNFFPGYTWGFQTEREVGAWEVAKVVGMQDLVTPAIDKTTGSGVRGVLMALAPGENAGNTSNEFDGTRDLARAAVFDYVIGNEDRHPNNWMIDEDHGNKMHLIDHSMTFPDKEPYENNNAYLIGEAAYEEREGGMDHNIKDIAKPYIENEAKISAALENVGLPKGSIAGVRTRIHDLAKMDTWQQLEYGIDEGRVHASVPPRGFSSRKRAPKPSTVDALGPSMKSSEIRKALGQHRYSNPEKSPAQKIKGMSQGKVFTAGGKDQIA